jgi:hypothetical protein
MEMNLWYFSWSTQGKGGAGGGGAGGAAGEPVAGGGVREWLAVACGWWPVAGGGVQRRPQRAALGLGLPRVQTRSSRGMRGMGDWVGGRSCVPPPDLQSMAPRRSWRGREGRRGDVRRRRVSSQWRRAGVGEDKDAGQRCAPLGLQSLPPPPGSPVDGAAPEFGEDKKRREGRRGAREEGGQDVPLRFARSFPCVSEGASSELLARSLHMRIPSVEICPNSERRFRAQSKRQKARNWTQISIPCLVSVQPNTALRICLVIMRN